jgi:hypothetical protein
MNIKTSPRTRITDQGTIGIRTQGTDKKTNSQTKDNDNKPGIRTRAGIPMPSGCWVLRGGVGRVA